MAAIEKCIKEWQTASQLKSDQLIVRSLTRVMHMFITRRFPSGLNPLHPDHSLIIMLLSLLNPPTSSTHEQIAEGLQHGLWGIDMKELVAKLIGVNRWLAFVCGGGSMLTFASTQPGELAAGRVRAACGQDAGLQAAPAG